MDKRVGAAILLIASSLAGCADETQPPATAQTSRDAWRNESNVGVWPFTVDKGVLTCYEPDWVTFTATGTEYALSDSARWIGKYQSVSPLLVDGYVEINDERQPVLISFDYITERGRELCLDQR